MVRMRVNGRKVNRHIIVLLDCESVQRLKISSVVGRRINGWKVNRHIIVLLDNESVQRLIVQFTFPSSNMIHYPTRYDVAIPFPTVMHSPTIADHPTCYMAMVYKLCTDKT